MRPIFFIIVIMFSVMLKSTFADAVAYANADGGSDAYAFADADTDEDEYEDSNGGRPVCPNGQIYNDCLGLCPPACRDETRACPAVCVPGCICAFNWVFDYNGRCIPRNFCCPQGRVESECKAHCQPTCEDPQGTRPCSTQCVRGCVCAPGTVLNRRGQCVKLSQC